MGSFLSGSSAMTVLTVEKPEAFSMDRLREEAFKDEGPLGEMRLGFVGLGDKFDTENFTLALCDGTMAGFAFRVDEQKLPSSAVKLEVEKRVRKEMEATGQKRICRAKRKDIAEVVVRDFLQDAPFSSTIVDCIWDEKKKRLYAGTTNKKILKYLQSTFDRAFGMLPEIVKPSPTTSVRQTFSGLAKGWNLLKQYEVAPMGDAVFAGEPEEEWHPLVSIKDSKDMMEHALKSMDVVKICLAAKVLGRMNTCFALTINQALAVSKLIFPKPEKGQGIEATFIIAAAICQSAADIVVAIANGDVE